MDWTGPKVPWNFRVNLAGTLFARMAQIVCMLDKVITRSHKHAANKIASEAGAIHIERMTVLAINAACLGEGPCQSQYILPCQQTSCNMKC